MQATTNTREQTITIGILDMHNGVANQAMRCFRKIVLGVGARVLSRHPGTRILLEEYRVRDRAEVPHTLDHLDILLSTGGPGSPFAGEGTRWEADYFRCIDQVLDKNQTHETAFKTHFLGICYSFQLMARHFDLATVNQREQTSFGIVPIYPVNGGTTDPLLSPLDHPFYAFDNRDWQVIDLKHHRAAHLGVNILSYDSPDEGAALTGFRITREMAGFQFHPEADKSGILAYFTKPENITHLTGKLGEASYHQMLSWIRNPNCVKRTFDTIVPGFLYRAIHRLMKERGLPTYLLAENGHSCCMN